MSQPLNKKKKKKKDVRLVTQGQALRRIPGIHRESLTLIFTMVDRCDPDSPHAAYWASLPKALMSGRAALSSCASPLSLAWLCMFV